MSLVTTSVGISIFVIVVTLILFIVQKYGLHSVIRVLKTYGIPFATHSDMDENVMKTPKKENLMFRNKAGMKKENVPKLKLPVELFGKIQSTKKQESSKEDDRDVVKGFQFKESNESDEQSFHQFNKSNDDNEEEQPFQFNNSNNDEEPLFQFKKSNDDEERPFKLDEKKELTFGFNSADQEKKKEEIDIEYLGSEDDVFEKPKFEFQRILADDSNFQEKKEEEEEEEEEAIAFVTKTEPQVSQDPTAADMYLLRELERYKVRHAQEHKEKRKERILKKYLEPLDKNVSVFDEEDLHKRLPKLNMSVIQGYRSSSSSSSSSNQRQWSCTMCNTKNSYDMDTCRACRTSKNNSTNRTCPACRSTSTSLEHSCSICGFEFIASSNTSVVVAEEEEDKDSVLLSHSVSLKGFVEEFALDDTKEQEEEKRNDFIKTKTIDTEKENDVGGIPIHSMMFDVQIERQDTPTKFEITRRRRQLIGSGPCLTPSGQSIFKPVVDNVAKSSSLSPSSSKSDVKKKHKVRDILAEMSMLWEKFPG
jgi:hypothetical protein